MVVWLWTALLTALFFHWQSTVSCCFPLYFTRIDRGQTKHIGWIPNAEPHIVKVGPLEPVDPTTETREQDARNSKLYEAKIER
jgi:hypothetical protein